MTDAELAAHLTTLRKGGVAIVMATHDIELVAQCATRVIMLGNGEIVADGDPRAVLAGSLSYTTQMNKVFGGTWLTVQEVTKARRATMAAARAAREAAAAPAAEDASSPAS